MQGVRVVVFEPEVDDVDSVDEMNTVDTVDRERAGAEGGADE